MEDWRVYLVIATSITALLAVLMKRALDRADEQNRAASRLRAYLLHWQRRALALNIWPILHLGEQWYKKDEQTRSRRWATHRQMLEQLLANETEYQEAIVKDLAKDVFQPEGKDFADFKEELRKTYGALRHLRQETIDIVLQIRKEIIEGTAFVADSDVAALDPGTLAKVVELRMTLASLVESVVWAIQLAEETDTGVAAHTVQKQLADAITAAIRVGYAIAYLTHKCDAYIRRRRFRALLHNMV
jgi:hypothetical protein